MHYDPIEPMGIEEARAVLRSEDLRAAARAVVAIGLHSEHLNAAADLLLSAASSSDSGVKGNAILSFGHLARRFRELPHEDAVRKLVADGLRDGDSYVRGHAHDAADDLEHFLGWSFSRHADA